MADMTAEPSLKEDRWLMIWGTLILLGSIFGCVALVWMSVDLARAERAHPSLALLIPIMIGLNIWNVFDCIFLVLRPARHRLRTVILRAIATFAPPIIVLALL